MNTERLILRPLKDSDAADIAEAINDLDVSRYLAVVPYPYSIDDAKNWIESQKKHDPGTDYTFGIEMDGKLIGAIGLHKINQDVKSAELGYWLGKPYWGQHIMTEATEKIIDFAFNDLKLKRLTAKVFTQNAPSARVLEKKGFIREGMLRQSAYSKASGQIFDEYLYGLLNAKI